MNVLDVFCGAAGGWSLGLERAGFRTVAACEIDPWRRAVFGRNFPHVRLYDDVRALTAARLVRDGVPRIDILAGSPPCQDASTANARGNGIDGERTGLFFEFIRLVAELRPAWVCAENVPGLRTRGVDRVLAALETEDYAVWPLVVGAWHAGAPHRRNRVWIVGRTQDNSDTATMHRPPLARDQPDGNQECAVSNAYAGGCETQERRLLPQSDGCLARDAVGTRLEESGRVGRNHEAEQPALERAIAERCGGLAQNWNGGIAGRFGMDARLPRGVARPALAAYGDAVLPQITEAIGRAILEIERQFGVAA